MELKKPCILVVCPPSADYPYIQWNGKQVRLHRFHLEKKLGRPIKPGYYALHHCDAKNCIEHEHLYEGTAEDNTRDAINRGNAGWWSYLANQTHCSRGHELTKENIYDYPGRRVCKICARIRADINYRKRR